MGGGGGGGGVLVKSASWDIFGKRLKRLMLSTRGRAGIYLFYFFSP